jgi:hypothetical protein
MYLVIFCHQLRFITMVTLSKFYSFVITAAKRHALVLGGIVGTAVAAAVGTNVTNVLTSRGTILSEKVAEKGMSVSAKADWQRLAVHDPRLPAEVRPGWVAHGKGKECFSR